MKKICINEIRHLPWMEKLITACLSGGAFGRTWSQKGSPLHGSHILLMNPEEAVALFQTKEGNIFLLNFRKTETTAMGDKIGQELKEQGIDFQVL